MNGLNFKRLCISSSNTQNVLKPIPVLHFSPGGTQVRADERAWEQLLVQASRHVRLQPEGSRDSGQVVSGQHPEPFHNLGSGASSVST